MREASNQRNMSTSSVEEKLQMNRPNTHVPLQLQNPKPIVRLSPRNTGSTLYDSFELKAMTSQLNKAIYGVNGSYPAFVSFKKSPFYSCRVGSIYKENGKSPRSRRIGTGIKSEANRGFVGRIWQKVKRRLLRNLQKGQGQGQG